jgi:hypothetical protein
MSLINTVKDPLLKQAQQQAEVSVPKKYQTGYNAIMAAGLKLMFSEKTFPMMQQYMASIKSPQEIPKVVAHGIVKVLSMLMNAGKGKFPLEASGPAAIVLMTHALEYLESVKTMEITADTLAETTRLVNQGHLMLLKQASGLDDNQFGQVMAGKGKELAAQLQAQAGAAPAGAPPSAPPASPAPVGGI